MGRMIQIGVAGLRDSKGNFLTPVPIYITEEDAGEINPETGMTYREELAFDDVSKIFADKFKQYADGVKKLKKTKNTKKDGKNNGRF